MEAVILDFINNVMAENTFLVYVLFWVSCVLQLIFPPHPADVVLIFQGYVTTINNSFNLFTVLINAMFGTFTGSYIVYKFGYLKGSMVFDYKLIKRYIDEKHKSRAERVFNKYGSYAIFLSKFIPGVNAIMILSAGVFKVKSKRFHISLILSILIHHILVLLLGRFLGYNLQYVKKIISTYNNIVGIILALVLIIIIIYYYIGKRKVDKEGTQDKVE